MLWGLSNGDHSMRYVVKYLRLRRHDRGIAARLLLCMLLAGVLLVPQAASAESEREAAEDRVIRLTLPLAGKKVTGEIVKYSTLTFTIETEKGKQHRVLWNAIPGANVDRYWRFLEEPEGDAQALFELGDLLIRHREGEALAEEAFTQALAIDPDLAKAVQQSRDGKAPDGSPRYVGVADPQRWGKLSNETIQAGVDTLHAFCKRVQREMEMDLRVYESNRFMVLTDVDEKRVQSLLPKLNKAYQSLSELLGEDPRGNLFFGKCLIVLFDQRVDYIRFQKGLHDTDARGTSGLCHGFGDGHVHIGAVAFGKQQQMNHLVVHELVHAYLHRYRSPVPLDDWINEGLAEHIAHQVVPPAKQNVYLQARLLLEGKKGLGEGFYDANGLEAWQYDVARAMTGYLFEKGKHAYPLFINAIKDGTATADALKDVYKVEPRVLTQRFKRRLDRELNKKLGG